MADKKAKEPKKAKKGKKGDADGGPAGISVSAHPRAAYSVRRAKGLGGLIGLLLVGLLSYRAGLPPFDAALRALVGGICGYLACWMVAVQVWRHLVVAEAKAAFESMQQRTADEGAS